MKKIFEWFSNLGKIESLLKQQLYQEKLREYQVSDTENLLLKGYGVYSQNDEDGILQEIFKRVGIKNRIAAEIAVGSGLESNTHLLLQTGWKCFWFETSAELMSQIKQNFKYWIDEGKLIIRNELMTSQNIVHVFRTCNIPPGLDLLSLDIDGRELSLWEAVSNWKPRVVIVEYNAALGPDVELTMNKNTDSWDNSSINFGSSLRAICNVAGKMGYVLVACNYTGVNAFFVKKKYASKFTNVNKLKILYQPPRLGGYIKPGFKRKPYIWRANDISK